METAHPVNTAANKYYGQIDGLRFLSIMGVLLQHFIHPSLSHFFKTGNAGVDLFFVISGFLITENLLMLKENKTSKEGLKIFFARRVLRIFPLYYFYWLILLVFYYAQVAPLKWWGLLYGINFYGIHHELTRLTGHLWSLSVEEQFYIVWPLLLLLVSRTRVFSLLVIVSLFSLFFFIFNLNKGSMYNSMHTVACSISLLTGAWLAYLKNNNTTVLSRLLQIAKVGAIICGIAFFVMSPLVQLGKIPGQYFLLRPLMCVIGFYWVGTAATSQFSGWFGKFLIMPFVKKIGQLAYGIYIYHYMVHDWVNPYFVQVADKVFSAGIFETTVLRYIKYNNSVVLFPFNAAVVIGFAWLSFHFFEYKFLALKKYFDSEGNATKEKTKVLA